MVLKQGWNVSVIPIEFMIKAINLLAPLKVKHKTILMVFTLKRALMWQAGAAFLSGHHAPELSAWRRTHLNYSPIQRHNLSLSVRSRLCKPKHWDSFTQTRSLSITSHTWGIALGSDMGGNTANGRGKLKVTLFTSKMTGKCIWKEIWVWSIGSLIAVCLYLTSKVSPELPSYQLPCSAGDALAARQLPYL